MALATYEQYVLHQVGATPAFVCECVSRTWILWCIMTVVLCLHWNRAKTKNLKELISSVPTWSLYLVRHATIIYHLSFATASLDDRRADHPQNPNEMYE